MQDSQCSIKNEEWQKPLQYCKVISLQLIKINGKKKEKKKNEEWEGLALYNTKMKLGLPKTEFLCWVYD